MTNLGKFAAFGPDLITPKYLLRKLEHDYARVQRNPRDTYAAFDFFVTAEHMVDWVSPEVGNDMMYYSPQKGGRR